MLTRVRMLPREHGPRCDCRHERLGVENQYRVSSDRTIPVAGGVVLRPATPNDAALLLEWRNERAAVRYSVTGLPIDAAVHARWLAARLSRPPQRLWIAEESGEPVGQARVDDEGATGIVSIAVAPEHRGRGIAPQILMALLVEMRADTTVRKLVAMVHPENTASLRAFERARFQDTGARRQGFILLEHPGKDGW